MSFYFDCQSKDTLFLTFCLFQVIFIFVTAHKNKSKYNFWIS
jgi:hypothetical protein